VSTIPLPFLLGLIEIHHDPFKQDPIYMYYGPSERTVDGMELNYQSRTDDPVYRITTASQTSFYESLSPLPGGKRILPGKIHHHPESEDILTYLESKKCFCFGRFARWRPDELAHESYRDIAKWAEFL
jgi:hypothetical protein